MDRLDNPVRRYAWGSPTFLPTWRGLPPSGEPEAELWIGAHPSAPSRLTRGGRETTLDVVIAANPERELGPAVSRAFGRRLPFLLKVLAAEEPLSLQAHPSLSQARAGFARETALGIPLDAAHRNYKDDNHKPEVLVALTPFEALSGFRPMHETATLFESLKLAGLTGWARALRQGSLADVFAGIVSYPGEDRARLVEAVRTACETMGGPFRASCSWAVRLARHYPNDMGVMASLLLNHIQLEPGEAIFLPAGQLHAYLHGSGLEIMANSDNVLRGGLTPKHVDVDELMRVLSFEGRTCAPLLAIRQGDEAVYETAAEEFRLSLVAVNDTVSLARAGAEILLCTEGRVSLRDATHDIPLVRGEAVFVAASDPVYTMTGSGTVCRACVNKSLTA